VVVISRSLVLWEKPSVRSAIPNQSVPIALMSITARVARRHMEVELSKADYVTLRVVRTISNWLLVLTSPAWVLPALLWYMFVKRNGEATGKCWFFGHSNL